MKRLLIPAALGLAFVTAFVPVSMIHPVQAQTMLRIVAVVNDEIISELDLKYRIQLQLYSMRRPGTEEAAYQIAPQVLRQMIDDKLRKQEILKRSSLPTDEEVRPLIAENEAKFGMPPGSLLASIRSMNLSEHVYIDTIKLQTAWERMLAGRIRITKPITEEDIDRRLAELKLDQGKPEYLLSDIHLTFDSLGGEVQARQVAETIIAELGRGIRFEQLAQQYSQSSASTAGNIGWNRPRELPEEVLAVVEKLVPGQVSSPIRTLTGYHIVMLRDRRIAAMADLSKTVFSLSQFTLPLPPNATPAEVNNEIRLARDISANSKSCEDFNALAKSLNGGPIGTGTLSQLPPNIANAVATIQAGQGAPPLRTPEGITQIFVCSRTDSGNGLPNREEVRTRILLERIDSESRKIMRDLRKAAIIDIRL
jgi:peptidyl-prolyl cis-trans isomerase SurA